MVPMIQRLQNAYGLDDITVVADAGVFSASNKKDVVDAGPALHPGDQGTRDSLPDSGVAQESSRCRLHRWAGVELRGPGRTWPRTR